MNGLQLARQMYDRYVKEMLLAVCDNHEAVCVGLAGEGSECLGFDDDHSKDHDFDGGLCIWVPDDTDDLSYEKISRAYDEIVKKSGLLSTKSALAPKRRGVFRVSEFYQNVLGANPYEIDEVDLIFIPDYCLCNATNGEIFAEGDGAFVSIREKIRNMPADVRLKKLAARLGYMANYGQYNYSRMYKRGDLKACLICKSEFMKNAAWACYLLEGRYSPYFKWMFKGLTELSDFARGVSNLLDKLLVSEGGDASLIIEEIAGLFAEKLKEEGISESDDFYLETQGLSLMSHIKNERIRAMHLLM